MFSLHSVSCKKPPTSECIHFFLLYTATFVSYIAEYEPWTWHHVAHLVFYLNLRTYIWKQTTHSVGCRFINIYCTVPVAFEIYSAIGLISRTIYNIAVRAVSTLCKPQANILKKIAETECRHFDKIFITDCTGRQLPVQPVMKTSSKWYFRFSARASWIILIFRADLVHVYITCCGHVYSYRIQYTSSM